MKKINLLIVGVGPHAKRVYIPHILNLEREYNVKIAAIVELKSKTVETRTYFKSLRLNPKQLYIDRFEGDKLPISVRKLLDDITLESNLNGIIISTEPDPSPLK